MKYRRRRWHPTPVLLPGKSHGQRSLVGCSPWGREESDTTERLHFHFLLSHIGEGNGNPLQCSCLENPREGGAWWAAVYGVTQSQTWLKRLSSSSSCSKWNIVNLQCCVSFRCTAKWSSYICICVCVHIYVCVSVYMWNWAKSLGFSVRCYQKPVQTWTIWLTQCILFQILFHSRLLQDTEYSSLC